ncbi:MAG: tRNA (adenosine(37)-N6)-threonylcarbamoyltransferase complex ATPase subunit type 1 TsaE [Dissulfurispiraceae bacterium]
MNRQIVTRSAEQTERLGYRLGLLLKKTGLPVTVCLYGDLGAGKTTFVKGFASAFGIPAREIGSASFVIVAEYETIPPFYHIDLYRLGNEPCIEDIGLWEYIEAGGIVVIEWAEKLGEMPDDALSVTFRHRDEDAREIVIEGIEYDDLNALMGDNRTS